MSGPQGSILSLRGGGILGSRGTNLGPKGASSSKVGEKRLVSMFDRGPVDQGALPWLISPPSTELWLRH